MEKELAKREVNVAVLESDALRRIFTPGANYSDEERDLFYRQVIYVGVLLTKHGVPVIFDATANRRKYRDHARQEIPNFLEVFVDTPLDVCIARDPKAIYRDARTGHSVSVPGIQAEYEPPEHPDVFVHGDSETPEAGARRVIEKLIARQYI